MKFHLEIMWISKDKLIVEIKSNVLPCRDSCESIVPQTKAKYVLEVNADFLERNRIEIGDRVDF